MSGIKDQKKIDGLRERLYTRGGKTNTTKQHALGDTPVDGVSTTFPKKMDVSPKQPVATSAPKETFDTADMAPPKKRDYRIKILLAAVGTFLFAVIVSSAFLLFGSNSISGSNISVTVTGPFVIGGGEVLPLQVGVSNENTVGIESATLIVNYPQGTRDANNTDKELSTERLALESIGSGETINIPLRAMVYGEENEEKTVSISVEYRVEGSNATFYKEAEPLRFKIGSSPIVLRADTLQKLSSGQETDITLTVTSNSPTTLSEVVVKAEYPLGFDYSSSDPEPIAGQNTWLIKDLEPESSQTITITGVVIGKETDEYAMNFTVGVPSERDTQSLASVFATTQTVFEIEQPFLDIGVEVNGSANNEVAIEPGDRPRINISVTNTLSDTLYDAVVEVQLSGNAFSLLEVSPSGGYYDTSNNTITWDVSNTRSLESVIPGDKQDMSFTIQTAANVNKTPQVNIDVNVRARRVSESQVAEALVGTAKRTIKVVSTPQVIAATGYDNGTFNDAGPIPPEVDKATTYTLSMRIQNGSNDVANAVVSTTLPPYVTYLENTAGAGSFSYNSSSRALEWNAGDIEANASTFASFQVSLLPRVTQIGTTPVLMGEQNIRATDRFTGTIVRDSSPAITTVITSQSQYSNADGVVQR